MSGQGSGGVPTSNMKISPLAAFTAKGYDVVYEPALTVAAAVAAAKAADVAIVFGSAHSGEGHDRADLLFSHGGKKANKAAASAASAGPGQNCTAPTKGIIGKGYIASVPAGDVGACCSACIANARCVAYTFTGGSECFLKDNTHDDDNHGKEASRVSATVQGRKPSPGPSPSPHPHPSHSGAAIEDVISAVGAVNKKTIVCAVVPGQILTDWRDDAAAILIAFLPGEQYACRAVQFHPTGGQSDFVLTSARTPHAGPQYVW